MRPLRAADATGCNIVDIHGSIRTLGGERWLSFGVSDRPPRRGVHLGDRLVAAMAVGLCRSVVLLVVLFGHGYLGATLAAGTASEIVLEEQGDACIAPVYPSQRAFIVGHRILVQAEVNVSTGLSIDHWFACVTFLRSPSVGCRTLRWWAEHGDPRSLDAAAHSPLSAVSVKIVVEVTEVANGMHTVVLTLRPRRETHSTDGSLVHALPANTLAPELLLSAPKCVSVDDGPVSFAVHFLMGVPEQPWLWRSLVGVEGLAASLCTRPSLPLARFSAGRFGRGRTLYAVLPGYDDDECSTQTALTAAAVCSFLEDVNNADGSLVVAAIHCSTCSPTPSGGSCFRMHCVAATSKWSALRSLKMAAEFDTIVAIEAGSLPAEQMGPLAAHTLDELLVFGANIAAPATAAEISGARASGPTFAGFWERAAPQGARGFWVTELPPSAVVAMTRKALQCSVELGEGSGLVEGLAATSSYCSAFPEGSAHDAGRALFFESSLSGTCGEGRVLLVQSPDRPLLPPLVSGTLEDMLCQAAAGEECRRDLASACIVDVAVDVANKYFRDHSWLSVPPPLRLAVVGTALAAHSAFPSSDETPVPFDCPTDVGYRHLFGSSITTMAPSNSHGPELAVFLLWANGKQWWVDMVSLIGATGGLCVRIVYAVQWKNEDDAFEKLWRMYGTEGQLKRRHIRYKIGGEGIADGPVVALILQDEYPVYGSRPAASTGNDILNIKLFDLKMRLRLLTGKNSVHASLSRREFALHTRLLGIQTSDVPTECLPAAVLQKRVQEIALVGADDSGTLWFPTGTQIHQFSSLHSALSLVSVATPTAVQGDVDAIARSEYATTDVLVLVANRRAALLALNELDETVPFTDITLQANEFHVESRFRIFVSAVGDGSADAVWQADALRRRTCGAEHELCEMDPADEVMLTLLAMCAHGQLRLSRLVRLVDILAAERCSGRMCDDVARELWMEFHRNGSVAVDLSRCGDTTKAGVTAWAARRSYRIDAMKSHNSLAVAVVPHSGSAGGFRVNLESCGGDGAVEAVAAGGGREVEHVVRLLRLFASPSALQDRRLLEVVPGGADNPLAGAVTLQAMLCSVGNGDTFFVTSDYSMAKQIAAVAAVAPNPSLVHMKIIPSHDPHAFIEATLGVCEKVPCSLVTIVAGKWRSTGEGDHATWRPRIFPTEFDELEHVMFDRVARSTSVGVAIIGQRPREAAKLDMLRWPAVFALGYGADCFQVADEASPRRHLFARMMFCAMRHRSVQEDVTAAVFPYGDRKVAIHVVEPPPKGLFGCVSVNCLVERVAEASGTTALMTEFLSQLARNSSREDPLVPPIVIGIPQFIREDGAWGLAAEHNMVLTASVQDAGTVQCTAAHATAKALDSLTQNYGAVAGNAPLVAEAMFSLSVQLENTEEIEKSICATRAAPPSLLDCSRFSSPQRYFGNCRGVISTPQAAGTIAQRGLRILRGLLAARVQHRDIHPGNLFANFSTGEVLLSDFEWVRVLGGRSREPASWELTDKAIDSELSMMGRLESIDSTPVQLRLRPFSRDLCDAYAMAGSLLFMLGLPDYYGIESVREVGPDGTTTSLAPHVLPDLITVLTELHSPEKCGTWTDEKLADLETRVTDAYRLNSRGR